MIVDDIRWNFSMDLQWLSTNTEDISPLSPGICHVWLFSLDENILHYERFLSLEEKARAARFVSSQVRHRFVVARGVMRYLLGHYVHCVPEKITLALTDTGKPYLSHHPHMHFNLSHSGHYALLAVTTVAPVGVDIEVISDAVDYEALVYRFFSISEQQQFAQLNPEVKKIAFFRGWCAKEAWVKAHGITLAEGLRLSWVEWNKKGEMKGIHCLRKAPPEPCDLPSIDGFASYCVVRGQVDEWQCYNFSHLLK